MSRYRVVRMPVAEARHLAGVGRAHPVSGNGGMTPTRPGGDREPERPGTRAASRPARGPFAPDKRGIVPPGLVEYLGAGTVRLDETAISSLAGLGPSADFRVVFTDSGPELLVGTDRYPATET